MSETNNHESYFNGRYLTAISWYDNKSKWNKKLYYLFQIILIVFAAITPILAVIDLKWFTTISSAIVAISASLIKFLKLEENWLNYRTICETLRKEQYLFSSSISDYNNCENKEKLFVDRVESLISRENTLWLSTCSTKEQT